VTVVTSDSVDCLNTLGEMVESEKLVEPKDCGCSPECLAPATCCPANPCGCDFCFDVDCGEGCDELNCEEYV